MNRALKHLILILFSYSCFADELALNFEDAKAIAIKNDADATYKDHKDKVQFPYFSGKYPSVVTTCFDSEDKPDDAKFELVIAIGKEGGVEKVYRNLDTNIGVCVSKELENDTFPPPAISPYYLHVIMDRLAGNYACPPGSLPNEKVTPDITVAWCEFVLNGETIMDGPYLAWWPNGRLGNYGYYNKGKPDGPWNAWYESGAIQGIDTYTNGILIKKERFPDE